MNDHLEMVVNPPGYWKLIFNFQTKEWFINEDERWLIGPFDTDQEAIEAAEHMFAPFNVNLT